MSDSETPGMVAHWVSLSMDFQVRILEWIPFPSPRNLPEPGIKSVSPALAGGIFTAELAGNPPFDHINAETLRCQQRFV